MDDLTVAIHQPNLYPWLGYFNKIAKADVFIFLDDVQIQKTGASYTNRVSIALGGKAHYITAPIQRKPGLSRISETRFADDGWRDRTLKTLQSAYSRAAHFRATQDFVFGLVGYPSDSLCDYNIHFVEQLSSALALKARRLRASQLAPVAADPTRRLAALVGAAGGTRYLSGHGAAAYQDQSLFAECGIAFQYIDNSRLRYRQPPRAEYQSGLSILDAIFNIGIAETSDLLTKEPVVPREPKLLASTVDAKLKRQPR